MKLAILNWNSIGGLYPNPYYPTLKIVDLKSKEKFNINFYNLSSIINYGDTTSFDSNVYYRSAYSQKNTGIQFFRIKPEGIYNNQNPTNVVNEPITTTSPQKLLSTTIRHDFELIQIDAITLNVTVIKTFTNFLCTYILQSNSLVYNVDEIGFSTLPRGDYVSLLQTGIIDYLSHSFIPIITSYENNFKIIFVGNISKVFQENSFGGLNVILSATSLRIIVIDKNSNITYIKLATANISFAAVGDNVNLYVIPGTLISPAAFYGIKRLLFVIGYENQITAIASTAVTSPSAGIASYLLYQIDMDTEVSTLLISSTTNNGYIFVGSYQDKYLYFIDDNTVGTGNFYQLNIDTSVITTVTSTTNPYGSYYNFIDLTIVGFADQAVMINADYLIFLNPISLAFLQQIVLPTYTNAIIPTMVLNEKDKQLIIQDSSANNQIIICDLSTKTFTNILL